MTAGPDNAALYLTRRRREEFRNVVAMSIPVVVTTSSRAVMDLADYIMITRLELPEAQAAILPAQVLMWSYIIIGMGIASMVNTFAAQNLGRKDYAECGAYAWQGLYVALLFGVVAWLLQPLLPRLVAAIGHDPAVQEQELAYGRVILMTAFPTIAANALGWFFIGIHKPWTTMWSALEANVVNVAVTIVLVFGYLGFEPMGIAGAAWGTLVAVIFRTLRLGATMFLPSLQARFAVRSNWRPSWRRMRNLFRVGIPCGLQWCCDVVVWAVFVNVLIGKKFGMVHLIATNTAWQYLRISFLPIVGVGQALTALVGKSIGAGDTERAKRETRMSVALTSVYMGVLSLTYGVFGARLIALFNDSPEVVAIGAKIMICAAVFQLFDGLAINYTSALRGVGDTFVPAVFFMVSNWVVIVGGGWVMVTFFPHYGSVGPWIAASTLLVVAGIFLWWRWQSGVWMRINLFDHHRPGAGQSQASVRQAPAEPSSGPSPTSEPCVVESSNE